MNKQLLFFKFKGGIKVKTIKPENLILRISKNKWEQLLEKLLSKLHLIEKTIAKERLYSEITINKVRNYFSWLLEDILKELFAGIEIEDSESI
jgi:sugar-specific transcriptional regulator TrmB